MNAKANRKAANEEAKSVTVSSKGQKKEATTEHKRLAEKLRVKHQGVKSKVIREMASMKIERAEIARSMNIIYQHVRNVLEMPLKGDKK